MNNYKVQKRERFKLELEIPGSKSITNRALILSALSKRKTILKNILLSDDTEHMINGLSILGSKIELNREERKIIIETSGNLQYKSTDIYIGNSGTTIRFLLSYLATGIGDAILYGNERMCERPIEELVEALKKAGVQIEYLRDKGYPPIKIVSNGRIKKKIKINGTKSSQYISSLLMAGSGFEFGIDLELFGELISEPYIKMTLNMLKSFGVEYKREGNNKIIIEKQKFGIDEYVVEGDCSSASYFLAMALITNSEITLKNYFKNSIQGDYNFLIVLKKLGLIVLDQTENTITIKGVKEYSGIEIDLNDMPDMAQTLAVVALFATTPTKITNVASMRIKETDRIEALKKEITKIGGIFNEWEDGFEIIPIKQYKAAKLNTYDDHRMAMALSLIGLKVDGIEILNPECVSKTFPEYFEIFSKIYSKNTVNL